MCVITRLYPIDILKLYVFDPPVSFLQILDVEIALIIWEVLALDTSAHDFLVKTLHSETWDIRVVVRPLVAISA